MGDMRRLPPDELELTLRIWLSLVPQWARRDWVSKHQDMRDRGNAEIARLLAQHLRKHEVLAPDPLPAHSASRYLRRWD